MVVQPVSVAQFGLGPIGSEIARLLLTKSWARLVAAVDVDRMKIGRDLGEVIGLGRPVGIVVRPELDQISASGGLGFQSRRLAEHQISGRYLDPKTPRPLDP